MSLTFPALLSSVNDCSLLISHLFGIFVCVWCVCCSQRASGPCCVSGSSPGTWDCIFLGVSEAALGWNSLSTGIYSNKVEPNEAS